MGFSRTSAPARAVGRKIDTARPLAVPSSARSVKGIGSTSAVRVTSAMTRRY